MIFEKKNGTLEGNTVLEYLVFVLVGLQGGTVECWFYLFATGAIEEPHKWKVRARKKCSGTVTSSEGLSSEGLSSEGLRHITYPWERFRSSEAANDLRWKFETFFRGSSHGRVLSKPDAWNTTGNCVSRHGRSYGLGTDMMISAHRPAIGALD